MVLAVNIFMVAVRFLPPNTLASCSWLTPLLREAIDIVKVYHTERLGKSETLAIYNFVQASSVIYTVAIACEDAVHSTLLEPSFVDALEYATMNDRGPIVGKSISADAAGILVVLLGRNEGGKTLSPATVNAVMTSLKANMTFKDSFRAVKPLTAVVPIMKNVGTMAISDTNKMLMLESEGAIETILTGLLLTSPRR
eukprot:SAG22_NODE_231_length_14551_cov_22.298090_20_plen_196_part_01